MGANSAQALTAVVLSIAAARSLGADGLGVYGLLAGGLVLATALATGLVGDSLTVLDRGVRHVRAGLQLVALGCAAFLGIAGAVVCVATGLLSWPLSLLFGFCAAVFVLEEFFRRLLMASLRFGSVLAVDLSALAATLCCLLLAAVVSSLDMAQILTALLIGQVVGIATAVSLLPQSEREIASWRGGDVTSVLRFGGWRAAQQAVRPAMLTAMRVLVVIAAGTVSFGHLEAARVYTAPTFLIITGLGGFLFATYASKKDRPLAALVRHADVGALAMCGGVVVVGAVAVALLPWAGRIVTGADFSIDEVAVITWVVYAAGAALLMPYGSLASVTGMHVKVFTFRLLESVISLAAVLAVLFVFHASPSWVPLALAIGPIALAVVIRQHVLMRRADSSGEDYEEMAAPAEAVGA